MARAPASTLPAWAVVFTVALLVRIAGFVDARSHGEGERGAPLVVLALVLIGVVAPGRRRPGSRRCGSLSDRRALASFLNARQRWRADSKRPVSAQKLEADNGSRTRNLTLGKPQVNGFVKRPMRAL